MTIEQLLPFAVLGIAGVVFLAFLLLLWALRIGARIRHAVQTRYDYKVVDVIVLQNPKNHEDQINKWAEEGWSIIACIPLIGGASEGVPEVRYVICKPWEPRRLSQVIRKQVKQKALEAAALRKERKAVKAGEEEKETPAA